MRIEFKEPEKQNPVDFKTLIELLVMKFEVMQVYQFAQLVQRQELNSVFCPVLAQEEQIYYLLVITAGSELMENSMQDFVDQTYTEAKVMALVVSQDTLFKPEYQYKGFFAAVINHGTLCYRAVAALIFNELRAPSPRKELGRAIVHWRNRYHMATGFLTAAEQAIDSEHAQVSLYLLHQCIEQACMGLMYVFMGYQSAQLDLKRLLYICACFSKLPLQHFLGTPANVALLNTIMKSSSQGGNAAVSLEDQSMYRYVELVADFLQLANSLCEAQFASLQLGVAQWKANRLEGASND